ncbi:actin maturation protease [Neocloeon triangulifer]|uniref:actin maturation protease n=1 Tax=Neocloeon triangulifer TaxID=2078957 RepID=UPI00286EFF83|nr:actin maturation protease [Neocloeon triangulifer]XP_059471139.1 actin maturation protease [Neocloeon triangulifer]XP_059471140.1 actin maturation protease [Neocloeon triangulifer]XP_059471142.1 actin maturation protease [Neocloeon triangulifer]
MSETTSETHKNKSGATTNGSGGPVPPPPPPSLPNFGNAEESKSPEIEIESHEAVVQKLVKKLCDWGSLGGSAALVISRHVQHIPQIGPKCGIVALNMALSVFLQQPITVDEILNVARERKYTNHGEMFCAENLKKLATHFLPNNEVQSLHSGHLRNQEFIAETLAAGDLLLVPYDSSRNFSPECLKGHKAHWAIITGIIIPISQPSSNPPLPAYKNLPPGPEALQEVKKYLPVSCLHVLALQGKSRHLSAWPLTDLVTSNENLVQIDPEREASDLEYIVPEGGLKQGLCGKALLLKRPN